MGSGTGKSSQVWNKTKWFHFFVLGEDAEASTSLDTATSTVGSHGQEATGPPESSCDLPGQKDGGAQGSDALGAAEGSRLHAHAAGAGGAARSNSSGQGGKPHAHADAVGGGSGGLDGAHATGGSGPHAHVAGADGSGGPSGGSRPQQEVPAGVGASSHGRGPPGMGTALQEEESPAGASIERIPKFRSLSEIYDQTNPIETKEELYFGSAEEPENFEEANQYLQWQQAMQEEINSIVENDTWKLADLPSNFRAIRLK